MATVQPRDDIGLRGFGTRSITDAIGDRPDETRPVTNGDQIDEPRPVGESLRQFVAGGLSAAVMLGIAWTQAVPPIGEDLLEARLEAIAQFLPTWCVVVAVLWHHLRGTTERS